MCKASVWAAHTRDPEKQEVLSISTGFHGLGSFHLPEDSVSECVTCLITGDELVLSLIPADLQADFGLDSVEPVVMIETPGSESEVIHDLLYFPNHPKLPPLPVVLFADVGVKAMVIAVQEDELDAYDIVGGDFDDIPATAGESRERVIEHVLERIAA